MAALLDFGRVSYQTFLEFVIAKLDSSHKYKITWLTENDAQSLKSSWTSCGTANYSQGDVGRRLKRSKSPVTHVKINGAVPPDLFSMLPHLTHLYIGEITPEQLKMGWAQLSKLKVLHLENKNEKYGSRTRIELPDFDNDGKSSLKELYLHGFDISEKCLSRFCKLEVLELIDVSVSSEGISQLFSSLTNLTKLSLCSMNLRGLPESISNFTKLRELDLHCNDFSLGGLPDVFDSFSFLERLNLSSCELADLPSSIRKLSRLQTLDLSCNHFEEVPAQVFGLRELCILMLRANEKLKSLDSRITMLKLEYLGTDGCISLTSPPQAVCNEGLQAIQKYYADALSSESLRLPITTVVVIGQTNAGKTSLVKTLQQGGERRVLTRRSSDPAVDEATRVFEYEKVVIEDLELKFVDLGGHGIYHFTYQLTFRDNFIPVVVVNLSQYEEYKTKMSDEKAVRKIFFDWMAHFYVSHPELSSPVLVLTHRDLFTEQEFNRILENFVEMSEKVRRKIISEELGEQKVRCLSSKLFDSHNTFVVGKDETGDFKDIKNAIYHKCQEHMKEIPVLWRDVETAITAIPHAFGTFDDLLAELSRTHQVEQEGLQVILTYLHNTGKLLYYKGLESLKPFVFYKIPEVTRLLRVLYDHHNAEKWVTRNDSFERRLIGVRTMEREVYSDLVKRFQETSIMDQSLLSYLILTETEFKEEQLPIAMDLLRTFKLLYGPITRGGKECCIIPYFSVGKFNREVATDPNREILLNMEILFKGLKLPHYLYYQMAMILLELFPEKVNTLTVRQNGASVTFSGLKILLIYDFENEKITLRIKSSCERIDSAWVGLRKASRAIIKHTRDTFRAVGLVCLFSCPHCLLKELSAPDIMTNPTWCEVSKDEPLHYDAMDPVTCKKDEDVPAILKYPCVKPTKEGEARLKQYVNRLRLKLSGSARVRQPMRPSQPAHAVICSPAEEELSELSDGDGFFFPDEDESKVDLGKLRAVPCSLGSIKELWNSDKVYKMSPGRRGRCLLINNQSFDSLPYRAGSDIDVHSLSVLLRSLNFVVEIVQNATAENMKREIRHEISNLEHDGYGMFILVIMSHGRENDHVYGVDGNTLKLTDVYDLLSANKFTQMAGKPKLVIVQACAGDKKDLGKGLVHTDAPSPGRQPEANNSSTPDASLDSLQLEHLDSDDFVVIKSSSENYVSLRHPRLGTLFIRCLTVTFYRHACDRDLAALCDIVRMRVREESLELARRYPDGCGQHPLTFNHLTGMKKVYLFPGYDGPRF